MNTLEKDEATVTGTVDRHFCIPLDLSEWVATKQLREWVIETIDFWNWSNPELNAALREHPEFEAKALFHVLTFGYATGVFASDEIVQRCSTDTEYRPLRPRMRHDAAEWMQFRKLNRGLLKLSLVEIITRAVKSQIVEGAGIRLLPAGLRRSIINDAVMRLDISRHIDRGLE